MILVLPCEEQTLSMVTANKHMQSDKNVRCALIFTADVGRWLPCPAANVRFEERGIIDTQRGAPYVRQPSVLRQTRKGRAPQPHVRR